jgi:predicted flap endonuclease-1-like 5' DNA nuclease
MVTALTSLPMWDEIFKRWVDLLFWWLPRTEETRPAKAEENTPSASEQGAGRVPEEAVEQHIQKAEEVAADDFTVVKGIGPAVQEKLRSLRITTFGDLAKADPDDLVDQLKASLPVSKARVRGWTEAARERIGPRA